MSHLTDINASPSPAPFVAESSGARKVGQPPRLSVDESASTADSSISCETAPPASANLLDEHWPTLSSALSDYQRNIAEQFSALAYDSIEGGIIRLEQRRLLARHAADLGIRPFDAQLLIACALRRWVLHHGYDATPSKTAPQLSFEYKSYRQALTRTALIAITFFALEFFILYKWLIAQ